MALIEPRQGILLNDLLHPFLPPPTDFSNWVFSATYTATILSTFYVLKRGLYFSAVVFISYSMLLFFRSIFIIVVPLEPPVGFIPLDDSFVRFFNSENIIYTKDLFFSGHTASMFFFYFIVNDKRLKYFLFTLALFVITAISIMRVHYTIDILGGITAAYSIFLSANYFDKKCWKFFHQPILQKAPILNSNTNLPQIKNQ